MSNTQDVLGNIIEGVLGQERFLSCNAFSCAVIFTSFNLENDVYACTKLFLTGMIQENSMSGLYPMKYSSYIISSLPMVLQYDNVQIACVLKDMNYNIDPVNRNCFKITVMIPIDKIKNAIKKILNRFELMDIDD